MKFRKALKTLLLCFLATALIVGAVVGVSAWREERALRQMTSMKDLFRYKYPAYRVSGMADYAQYTYEGLWRSAYIIALVTPMDELTPENSFGISDTGDRFYEAHSIRRVRALTFYKNDWNYDDEFEMAEYCAMLSDGSVVGMEDSYPMQMGEEYLVFLTWSGLGYPIIISEDNGKFDLTNLRLNHAYRQPLIAQAVQDQQLDTRAVVQSGDTEAEQARACFLDAEYVADNNDPYDPESKQLFHQLVEENEWNELRFTTDYTRRSMRLTVEYAVTEDGYLYRMGNEIYGAPRT